MKSQSLNQSINNCMLSNNTPNTFSSQINPCSNNNNNSKKKNNLMGAFNESTSSLPIATTCLASPLFKKTIQRQNNITEFKPRSPIMIVYDCDEIDDDNLKLKENNSILSSTSTRIYQSNESSNIKYTPNKNTEILNFNHSTNSAMIAHDLDESNQSNKCKKTQISYV